MLMLAIAAYFVDVLTLSGIVQIGKTGIVKLQIRATKFAERGNFFGVDLGEIAPEFLHVRIDCGINGRAPSHDSATCSEKEW